MISVPGLEALATDLPAAVVSRLGWASLAGALFVAAVWLVTRLGPRLPSALHCALWWAAALKLLVAFLWVSPVELPLLPAPAAPVVTGEATTPIPPAGEAGPAFAHEARALGSKTVEPVSAFPWWSWLAALWLAGVALGALRLVRELVAARRLRSGTRPADATLTDRFHDLRRRLGVRAEVELRLSEEAAGPLTLGALRPTIVLPTRDLGRLSAEELDMALGHELLHVRRRDLWAGWVPRLARCLFFFHPFASLAAREYRLAREAACDAGVVRELGAVPRSYGRLLLHWSRRRPGPPALAGVATAGASSSFLDLKRRLVMLQNPSPSSWRLRAVGGALVAVALAALLPLRIVAQESDSSSSRSTTSTSTWTYTDDGEAWALVEPGGDAWIHGSSIDVRRIRAHRDDADTPLLWFRRDGREYVVRDPAVLEQAREILEPQRELGRRQGELGARQGELGAEQGELGAQQGELGRRQGELGAEQGELGARMAALAAEQAQLHLRRMNAGDDEHDEIEAEEAAIEERMERLEERMEELGRRQAELGRRQEALGREQGALGNRQEALGERQAELGRQQEEAARRAAGQLRELLDRAVAQGLAEPVS